MPAVEVGPGARHPVVASAPAADIRISLREAHAGSVAHGQDGVVAPACQADGDQVGHPCAGLAGEQQHVGPVLDLVLAVSVGPESLYQTNRNTCANRRASVASRPTTSIARSPAAPAV